MTITGRPQVQEQKLSWSRKDGRFAAVDEARVKGGGFIKGPIPLLWINLAACLPGKTLQVGIALWFLVGLKKSPTVMLASKTLTALGVSRDAKYDALQRLEAAGLVSVQRQPGRAPLVTVLPPPC